MSIYVYWSKATSEIVHRFVCMDISIRWTNWANFESCFSVMWKKQIFPSSIFNSLQPTAKYTCHKPSLPQAIIWNNDGISLIKSLEILLMKFESKYNNFNSKKMYLKMLCVKWQTFCYSLTVWDCGNHIKAISQAMLSNLIQKMLSNKHFKNYCQCFFVRPVTMDSCLLFDMLWNIIVIKLYFLM